MRLTGAFAIEARGQAPSHVVGRPRIPRLSLVIVPLVVATLLATAAVFVTSTIYDRDLTMAAAEREQSALALLMSEHIHSAIETDGAVLGRMSDLVKSAGSAEQLAAQPTAGVRLRQIMADTSAVQSLLVLDPTGHIRLSTYPMPGTDTGNRADRDYFQEVRPPAPTRDFISPMIRGRMTGNFLFAISRRVDGPDGRFLGVVQSSIDARYFASLYQKLTVDPSAAFGIYKRNGGIVSRYPLPQSEEATARARDEMAAELAGRDAAGTYIARSRIDGIERLFAFHTLSEAGLIVVSGQSINSILHDWYGRTRATGAIVGGVMVVEVLLAIFALVAARRTEAARRQAFEALQSKSTFFASASHDLRQPFQAMRLFWMVIHDRMNTIGDSRIATAVEKLGTALDSGEELLNALLDIATLEAGRVVPKFADFPVQQVIDAERETYAGLIETRGLRLRTVPSGRIVRSDPILLRRMLRNLLVNAIKYTERGGILIGCRQQGQRLKLQVWDTGKGIPEDQLSFIFEDFYQVDNQARSSSQGLGLGLSVVARTARLLDHQVAVRSHLGKGTMFEIEIPLSKSPGNGVGYS